MKRIFYLFCLYCVSTIFIACNNNVQPRVVFVEKDKYSTTEIYQYSKIIGSFLNYNYKKRDIIYMINEKGEKEAFEVVDAGIIILGDASRVRYANELSLQNTDLEKEIYIWSQIDNLGEERYLDISYKVGGEITTIRAEGFDVNQDVIHIEDDIILTLKKNVGITYIGNNKGNYNKIQE